MIGEPSLSLIHALLILHKDPASKSSKKSVACTGTVKPLCNLQLSEVWKLFQVRDAGKIHVGAAQACNGAVGVSGTVASFHGAQRRDRLRSNSGV